MDDTITTAVPHTRPCAYLSVAQIEYYGGFEAAKAALGVMALVEPEVLLEKTVGMYPHFYEIGHA